MRKSVTLIYKGYAQTHPLGLTKRMGENRIPFLKQYFARNCEKNSKGKITFEEALANMEVHIHEK